MLCTKGGLLLDADVICQAGSEDGCATMHRSMHLRLRLWLAAQRSHPGVSL